MGAPLLLLELEHSSRNTDLAAFDRDDRTRFDILAVIFQNLCHQSNSLLRRDVRQSDQTRMRSVMDKHQRAEVRVDSHKNTFSLKSHLQQRQVSWVRAEGPALEHVMALRPQPSGKPSTGTAIYEELHRAATWTESKESWAMTAWAYVRQAWVSSGSRSG